jgi:hypothetical protein
MLRLQATEHEKQLQNLTTQVQNERKKFQTSQEKQHILEAKLAFLLTKKSDLLPNEQ